MSRRLGFHYYAALAALVCLLAAVGMPASANAHTAAVSCEAGSCGPSYCANGSCYRLTGDEDYGYRRYDRDYEPPDRGRYDDGYSDWHRVDRRDDWRADRPYDGYRPSHYVCDPDGDRCYHSYSRYWNYREYYRRHGYHWVR